MGSQLVWRDERRAGCATRRWYGCGSARAPRSTLPGWGADPLASFGPGPAPHPEPLRAKRHARKRCPFDPRTGSASSPERPPVPDHDDTEFPRDSSIERAAESPAVPGSAAGAGQDATDSAADAADPHETLNHLWPPHERTGERYPEQLPNLHARAMAEASTGHASGRSGPERASPGFPEYPEILARLRQRVTGHDDVLHMLALCADHRYRRHGPRTRALIVGESGSGKSHLAASLGWASRLPVVVEDASAISEHGWEGRQVADVARRAFEALGYDLARLNASGVVLILDEFDKAVACRRDRRGRDVDPRSTAVRASRQAALLQLVWGTTPVAFQLEGHTYACRTDRWLVLCLGAFAGAPWARPGARVSDADLVSYGVTSQMASRLTQRWVLGWRTLAELERILWTSRDGVRGLEKVAESMGVTLAVSPEAVRATARLVADGEETLRGAQGRLAEAVLRKLTVVLDAAPSHEVVVRVAPDDVLRPAQPRTGSRGRDVEW